MMARRRPLCAANAISGTGVHVPAASGYLADGPDAAEDGG
jgi:hypothetical protein